MRAQFTLKKNPVLDDLRVIDMYEAAIRHDLQVYTDRKGNWVQKLSSTQDAALFVTAQFYRYADVDQFLREQFEKPAAVYSQLGKSRHHE